MRRLVFAVFLSVCAGFPGIPPAAAEPAYSASDILKHFAPGTNLTRSLCVGTEAECGARPAVVQASAALPAFDLIVTFDFNSDHLTAQARQNLDEFVIALQDPRLVQLRFLIDGHTDAKGGEAYNLKLSERRANAVVGYLAARGVDVSRLTAKGYGKAQPKTENPFDADNRRVEARLNGS